ncbi:MAG: sugar phosphate isomerase/epimerase family protein, partial [Planctomycetaceae bacterium]
MKYGMNLLLWTAEVGEAHYPLLEQLKGWGYDGVELPIFAMDEAKFAALGKKLDAIGLERTAVTVQPTPETNPISADPKQREAGLNHLQQAIDMCAAAGAPYLCGP